MVYVSGRAGIGGANLIYSICVYYDELYSNKQQEYPITAALYKLVWLFKIVR